MELNDILKIAVEKGASDVHLKPGMPPVFRVDGKLVQHPKTQRLTPQQISAMAKVMMSERQVQRFRENCEVDLAYSVPGVGRFRTNVFQQRGTVAISMRLIPFQVAAFSQLGLPKTLEKISMEGRGLVLVAGTTGSGKSTTLASMVQHINENRTCHIITIEDPIEFLLRDKKSIISQREIGFDTLNFVDSLRSALRQDPDVILVGEMRDMETIQTALMAAETGHLVLSTVHTMDAMETVNRIISFFAAYQQEEIRFQLASVLKAVICQRLIPRMDGKGRVPAVEVLVSTARVRDCIRDRKKTPELNDTMAQGYSTYGMQTFDMALMDLYMRRMITREEALANSSNPGDFEMRVSGVTTGDDSNYDEVAEKGDMVIERFQK
ncbi:MAG: type IV pilus twitching motility protein PilT [Candidatus Alcyoniella australis]|nr:type IV pilus twitching motility protein PilT [Candidatus Alcyoniella australis]